MIFIKVAPSGKQVPFAAMAMHLKVPDMTHD